MTTATALLSIAALLLASPARAQWTAAEEARLSPPVPSPSDNIGASVSISGAWAVVGAPLDDTAAQTAGAAHVFRRDPSGWVHDTTLYAAVPGAGDQFGSAVSVAGDLIAVGAPNGDHAAPNAGAAYLFQRVAGAWTQILELGPSAGATGDRFGESIATDGLTVLVGAPHVVEQGFVDVGAVYAFIMGNGTWVEEAKLLPSNPQDKMDFGEAVAVDGDRLIIAARFMIRCYVFERVNTQWTEISQVTANNLLHAGGIGRNCAINGDTLVFGAPSDDLVGGGLTNAGSAYVYVRTGSGVWSYQARLKAQVPAGENQFGRSVAVDGDVIVIGANGVDTPGATDSGAGYLFRRTGTVWSEDALMVASDADAGAELGRSAALADGLAILGAPAAGGTGAGYVFAVAPPPPVSYCTAGTSASGCAALLSTAGAASATQPSGFVVTGNAIEGSKDGMFFFASNGRQANPWGSGTSFQCVAPPVKRSGLMSGSGTVGVCDGILSQDLNARWCPTCPKPNHNPGAGALVQAQLWYRDPLSTSNQTTSLSDAIEFGLGP